MDKDVILENLTIKKEKQGWYAVLDTSLIVRSSNIRIPIKGFLNYNELKQQIYNNLHIKLPTISNLYPVDSSGTYYLYDWLGFLGKMPTSNEQRWYSYNLAMAGEAEIYIKDYLDRQKQIGNRFWKGNK